MRISSKLLLLQQKYYIHSNSVLCELLIIFFQDIEKTSFIRRNFVARIQEMAAKTRQVSFLVSHYSLVMTVDLS